MAKDWALIFRPVPRRVLEALLGGRRSLTELAAATKLTKPSLLPHLRNLAELGVVRRVEVRTAEGREVHFEIVPASIHLELRPGAGVAIAWATAGRQDAAFPLASQIADEAIREDVLVILRQLRKRFAKEFPKMFVVVFGSVARGEATWKSDIDLFLVLEDSWFEAGPEDVLDAIADVQDSITHPVRTFLRSRGAFLRGTGEIEKAAAEEGLVLFAPEKEVELWQRMTRHKSISI
jgi:predicted nucleotidyltransferase